VGCLWSVVYRHGRAQSRPSTQYATIKVRVMQKEKGGWVYFLSNRPSGTLYAGVSNDLIRRVWEHKEGKVDGFSRRYYLKRLVYFERHEDIVSAIQRETSIKHWPRAWKVNLIIKENPAWDDLYGQLL
jgi:putative endonuclease